MYVHPFTHLFKSWELPTWKFQNLVAKLFSWIKESEELWTNTFRILASRFWIFHTKILDSTETVVLTCVLHNFLRHQSNSCSPSDSEELEVGQSAYIPLQDRYNKHHGPQGKEVRDIYLCYFSDGQKSRMAKWNDRLMFLPIARFNT
jgi:hypothetical protein